MFIRLTDSNGIPVTVNTDCVERIKPDTFNWEAKGIRYRTSMIVCQSFLGVREHYEDIMKVLDEHNLVIGIGVRDPGEAK